MNSRIKSSKSLSAMDYAAILMIIISSGTAFFFMYNAGLTIVSLFLISCIFAIFKHSKIHVNLYVVVYSLLIILSILMHGLNISIIGYVIFLISTYLIISSISYNIFCRGFLNIVVILSIISIILQLAFFVDLIAPMLYGNGKNGLNGHYIFAFHVFGGGQWGISNRLSGIFWEPGIYQIVLNLAIIFNLDLFDKKSSIRHRKGKLYILISSIILTTSTTGYLVFGAIIIGRIIQKSKNSLKFKIFTVFGLILFLASCVLLPVIADKFSDDNPSYLIRMNDVIGLFQSIWINPFIGLGVASKTYEQIMFRLGVISQSAGLLQQTAQLGIFWALAFYYSCCQEYRKRKIKIPLSVYLVIITMLGMCEPIMFAPLMLINVLPFKKYNHEEAAFRSSTNLQYGKTLAKMS